jgi:hypothetical protein
MLPFEGECVENCGTSKKQPSKIKIAFVKKLKVD